MYYKTVTYTTTGTTDSANLDPTIAPFSATVGVTLTAGTASFKLQYSVDPPNVDDSAALWFDSTEIPAATSASIIKPLTLPVSRVRLVIAALSGGNLILQIQQGLSIN